MSLAAFKTELVPSPGLRKIVLLGGAVALLAGSVIILYLPVPLLWRCAICVLWFADSGRELVALARGAARVRSLQLDANGDIFATGPHGRSEYLVLLSGSVVWSRLAWLRLRFADGSMYAELLAGDPLRDRHWQRLQLIWQQSRGAFALRK